MNHSLGLPSAIDDLRRSLTRLAQRPLVSCGAILASLLLGAGCGSSDTASQRTLADLLQARVDLTIGA